MATYKNELSATLFVRNLPHDAEQSKFQDIFSNIGPIKKTHLVRTQDNMCKGYGYVTFAVRQDAEKAINETINYEKNRLSVKFSHSKNDSDDTRQIRSEPTAKRLKYERKFVQKQGRLIIRNLSFKCNEKTLRKEFEKYGNLDEISIAKKADGKMKGFAFIQFETSDAASKAIEEKNATEILGRPVAIDWAVSKDRYLEAIHANDTSQQREKTEEVDQAEKCATDDDIISNENDDDVEDDDDDDDSADEELKPDETPVEKSKRSRHSKSKTEDDDVHEGRTVFVRNLPFDVEDEEMKEIFSQFGKVVYFKICFDKITEHSKGTAFIQFASKEDADNCLDRCGEYHPDGGLIVEGRRIYANLAVSRNKIKEIADDKFKSKNETKDKRNLYLAREGLIRAGTKAAEGISTADLTKRANLESRKRRLLKDLKMFASRTRLAVYNLPPSVNDKKLKSIFLTAAGDVNAKIVESRVMKDLNKTDTRSKFGKSKGHGYVEFTEHEHALQALRNVNNNPETFGDVKRPIVEFSIENLQALKTRQRRLEKSKENNNKSSLSAGESKKEESLKQKRETKFSNKVDVSDVTVPSFTGTISAKKSLKQGLNILPTHSGPKIRHKKRNTVQQNKSKLQKNLKRKMTVIDSGIDKREPKKKKIKSARKSVKEDNFSILVDKYKSKISNKLGDGNFVKSKWFDS